MWMATSLLKELEDSTAYKFKSQNSFPTQKKVKVKFYIRHFHKFQHDLEGARKGNFDKLIKLQIYNW